MGDFPASWVSPQRGVLSTVNATVCPAAEAVYVTRGGFNGNGAWPSANRALFAQIVVEEACTVTQMAVLNAATVAGNLSLGIFNQQMARLNASNAAMAGATTIQVIDITDTLLTPGVYYLAMSSDSATATFNRAQLNGVVLRAAGGAQMDTAYPLPATLTVANPSSYLPVIVALTAGTVI